MTHLINTIKTLFEPEVNELWVRYQTNDKKPHYFPYNKTANNLDDMIKLSFDQMISATNHLKTYDSWKELKNTLTFEQWIVYTLLISSLKDTNESILQRVQLLM